VPGRVGSNGQAGLCGVTPRTESLALALLQAHLPFAVVGSTEEVKVGNKLVRARQYLWGVVQGKGLQAGHPPQTSPCVVEPSLVPTTCRWRCPVPNRADGCCTAFCGSASLSFELLFLPAGRSGQGESLCPRGCGVPCAGRREGDSGVNP